MLRGMKKRPVTAEYKPANGEWLGWNTTGSSQQETPANRYQQHCKAMDANDSEPRGAVPVNWSKTQSGCSNDGH